MNTRKPCSFSCKIKILLQTVGPLNVLVEVSSWPQVEGVEVFLRCTVVGSNPPARVLWYQHSRLLRRGTVNVSEPPFLSLSLSSTFPHSVTPSLSSLITPCSLSVSPSPSLSFLRPSLPLSLLFPDLSECCYYLLNV